MRSARAVRRWILGPLAILLVSSAIAGSTSGAGPEPGSAGIDTSLPATDSQVTVRGRGTFENLEITVNQTRNLTTQAVSITWKGGAPTLSGPGRFASNYLQIFQCWGDDDGTVPENPGPRPRTVRPGRRCRTVRRTRRRPVPGRARTQSRHLAHHAGRTTTRTSASSTRTTRNVWLPFEAVTGKSVPIQVNSSYIPEDPDARFWLNDLYNIITTNEIAGGATGPDGTGAELMQLLTGVQSTGLGCGQRVQPTGDGGRKIPQCWIVVVPRGTPTEENVGTPFAVNADQAGVATSPVAPTSWANRIAIPLEFNPIDSPCSLQNGERRIGRQRAVLPGHRQLAAGSVRTPGSPPYSYAPVADSSARRQLTSPTIGSPGLVAISQPVPVAQTNDQNPIVYAPLAASGVTIGFNIERVPKPTSPPEAQNLSGVRISDLKLTPRLVAKLLTQSYSLSVRIVEPPDYDWVGANPSHIGLDPDFVQFNPEFAQLGNGDRNFSALTVPTGNSDAAKQLWERASAIPRRVPGSMASPISGGCV